MARSTKAKPDGTATIGADRSPNVLADTAANITEDAIARRAFELYLARDREHGDELDDWLSAERELRGSPTDR